jgi:hypothetical protein
VVAAKISGLFENAASAKGWTEKQKLALAETSSKGSLAEGPVNDQLQDLYVEQPETETSQKDDPSQYKGQSAMDMLVRRNNPTQPDPNANKPVDRQTQQALNVAKNVAGQNNYFTQAPKIGLAETGTEAKSIAKQGQEAKQVVAQMQKGQIALKQMEGTGNNAQKPTPTPAPTTGVAGMDTTATGAGSLATNGRGSSSELDKPSRKEGENDKTVTTDASYSSTPAVDTRQTQSQAFLNNMSKGAGFGNDDIAERSTIASMFLTDEDTKVDLGQKNEELKSTMKSIEIHAQEAGLGIDKYKSQGLVASVENFDRVKNPSAFAL